MANNEITSDRGNVNTTLNLPEQLFEDRDDRDAAVAHEQEHLDHITEALNNFLEAFNGLTSPQRCLAHHLAIAALGEATQQARALSQIDGDEASFMLFAMSSIADLIATGAAEEEFAFAN